MKNALLFSLVLILAASACKSRKESSISPEQTMVLTSNNLVKLFRNGEVSECSYKNKKYYSCQLNAHDAGYDIFDIQGNKVCSCYYGNGPVDDICDNLENCLTVYRTSPNIWGRPGVKFMENPAPADSAKK